MKIYHYLIKELGKDTGKLVYTDFNERLCKLKEINTGNSKEQQRTMEKHILPVIALYQALDDCAQISDPMKLSESYVWENKEREKKCLSLLGHSHGFFALFRKIVERKLSGDNWDIEMIANTENCISFHILRCLWFDTLKNNNCEELCHIFCHNDEILYGGLSDSVKFCRKKTLGTGGKYCDFCFYH